MSDDDAASCGSLVGRRIQRILRWRFLRSSKNWAIQQVT
jgi:hypothetical protein